VGVGRGRAATNDVYVAVYRRAAATGWPYDFGDDPSFEASQKTQGRITWGVCRPDVRGRIKPGDLVIFIAVDPTLPARYQFVGYATVDQRVSREAIWREPQLGVYQEYRNLLVRRVPNGYVHDEPRHFGRRVWHQDWLHRIIDVGQRHCPDLLELQRQKFLPDGAKLAGQALRFGENYIIFRPHGEETHILIDPPTIAFADINHDHEQWSEDRFAQGLREVLIAPSPRDYLRTMSFRPHPYIRLSGIDVPAMRDRLQRLILSKRRSRSRGGIAVRSYPNRRRGC